LWSGRSYSKDIRKIGNCDDGREFLGLNYQKRRLGEREKGRFWYFCSEKDLVTKLSDSDTGSAETQVWLDYSFECRYLISPSPRLPVIS
jgi:hypothetical protein